MAAPRRSPEYFPGQSVPTSGIYRAEHHRHRAAHEVIAIEGEVFPGCRRCRGRVKFVLLRPASHMTHDMDLAGPQWNEDDGDSEDLAS